MITERTDRKLLAWFHDTAWYTNDLTSQVESFKTVIAVPFVLMFLLVDFSGRVCGGVTRSREV